MPPTDLPLPSPPPPGSDAAIAAGCRCPRLDNAHGRGYMGIPGIYVWREDCPLHGGGCPPPPEPGGPDHARD